MNHVRRRRSTHYQTGSNRFNDFLPEFHFLAFLLKSYFLCLPSFATQGKFFDNDVDVFSGLNKRYIGEVLSTVYEKLGRPRSLVFKHCGFCRMVPFLLKEFPDWKHIVILRDPRDVLASEMRGYMRARSASSVPEHVVENVISQYNDCYSRVLSTDKSDGRVFGVRFENIVQEEFSALESFVGDKLHPDRLWASTLFDINTYEKTNAYSHEWGRPLTSETVGSYRKTINEEVASVILSKTAQTVASFDARFCNSTEKVTTCLGTFHSGVNL